MMKNRLQFLSVLPCLFLLIQFGTAFSLDNVKEEVFREAKNAFSKANGMDAERLSPKNYSEAKKHFVKAQDRFNEGDKLESIRKDLAKSMDALQKAMEAAELGKVVLKDAIAIRSETVGSGLAFSLSNDFREAEKKFKSAAEKVEKDDVKGARKPITQAIERYRAAVLWVLEKDVISDAKRKLKNSKKSISKDAYKQAESALKALEKQVKSQKKEKDFVIAELTSSITGKIDQVFSDAGI